MQSDTVKNDTLVNFLSSLIFVILFLGISILFYGCKKEADVVSSNGVNLQDKSIISGQVVDRDTGFPIDSAIVRIFSNTINTILYTSGFGQYSVEAEFENNESLFVTVYKNGYKTDTSNVEVVAGQDLAVPLVELKKLSGGGDPVPSGDPVSIFLSSISSTVIGVKESGSVETTRIEFIAQDSVGVPIDSNHVVAVHFSLGAGPGGGEFLSPPEVMTNSNGAAVVNLTSGIKAGAVQVIAKIFLANSTITSLPVAVTIHGGLPDLTHFSIAPAMLNFPGYNIFGLENPITAFVGDKYANPVRPETAVYFTSTGGIIEGSVLTNPLGVGSVNLISAEPRPNHPVFGEGFATITASTIDENSQTISKETIVLFSGIPQISINPTSINVPNGGSQSFSYFVGDQNGNPLAE
ncbi:MAG: Ig-like domain-containing protein, partial [Ignavibacteria bacterium]|nr:Ig-like domain-containing protein [Ignavibacteria bacterium]